MTNKATKQERLQHANALIKIIAAHGRRFFFSLHTGKTAELFIGKQGRVYLIDDYTREVIFTHETKWTNKWRGFSHGGTLRGMVEMMRDYIVKGKRFPPSILAQTAEISLMVMSGVIQTRQLKPFAAKPQCCR